MKPIDYRNETWDQVWERMDALRSVVYRGLQSHGPCTTRQLALRMGLDILSIRPRVTELCQLDLAEIAEPEAAGREGIYQHVPIVIAVARFKARKAQAHSDHLTLF